MITILGSMVVSRVERDGDMQNVGLLECDLGKFQVSYPQLESFEEGRYEAFFNIVEFQQNGFNHQGRYSIEMEAVIREIALLHISMPMPRKRSVKKQSEESKVKTSNLDFDFDLDLDSDSDSTLDSNVTSENTCQKILDIEHPDDAQLFGSLWPLTDRFQLDPTVNRDVLKAQKDRLLELGYKFILIAQTWVKEL